MKKITLINFTALLLLAFSNPAQAKYMIDLSPSASPEDLTNSCKGALFNVLEDINSKESQDIKINFDKQNQNSSLSFILSKDNIMTSPGLQTYWSNLLYQGCPTLNKVTFGKFRTDWIIHYVLKNEKMLPSYKPKPNILGLKYGKAREIIIKEGWQPIKTRTYDSGYLNFVASKYPEVHDCAGTGVGACVFYFQNPDEDYYLQVATAGQFFDEENGDGKIHAVEVKSVTDFTSDDSFQPFR